MVLANPTLASALVEGMNESDPLVRMRSADAFEKVTAERPQLSQKYRLKLLPLISAPQPKEVLWHLLQVAPRVKWAPQELSVVQAAVARAHLDSSGIVKACALQAEVELLAQSPERQSAVLALVRKSLASSVPAVRARARKLAALMGRPNPSPL